MKRRHLLTTSVSTAGVGVGVAGCLDNGANVASDESDGEPSKDDIDDSDAESRNDTENDDKDGTDTCEIASREERGKADPIETTAIDNESFCGYRAAEEVVANLDEQLDLDLADASWISPTHYDRGANDEYAAASVYAQGSDGEITTCPDTEWDFDDALEVLPSEITLILTDEDGEKQDECRYEVILKQGTMWVG